MRGYVPVAQPALAARFAGAVVLFLIAVNLPYAWLVARFGYDDILREPAAVILRAFASGGDMLVLAWLAFATGALLFIPVALTLRSLLLERGVDGGGAAMLGIASAVAQAAGLLRWVLVVPALATMHAGAEGDAATGAAVIMAFEVVHRFGGMVLGEMIGQLLVSGWTFLSILGLWQSGLAPRWLLWVGATTVPLWFVGQTELLHAVVPTVPAIEVVPAAFMLWEAWLAAVAVAVLVRRRPTARATTNGARVAS
jgi:hypothetical protein